MGWFKRKKTETEVGEVNTYNISYGSYEEYKDKLYVVHIMTDFKADILHRWLNDVGIYPTSVMDNIEDAKYALLNEVSNVKVLFIMVETGNGLLGSMTKRKDVIDLLGNSTSDNIDVVVLYTDNLLRKEVRESKIGKGSIEWVRYTGSKSVAEVIASKKHVYEKGSLCRFKGSLLGIIGKRVVNVSPEELALFYKMEGRELTQEQDKLVRSIYKKWGMGSRRAKIKISDLKHRLIECDGIGKEYKEKMDSGEETSIKSYKVVI